MRIISGKYKGMNLASVPGFTTRPTTDYTRAVIFSILPDCAGLKVLDLYAGTGSLGLEALSRGAEWVDFVEFSNKAIAIIRQNIDKLRLRNQCHLYKRRVEAYLKDTTSPYDLIFLDPPYAKELVNNTLTGIYDSDLLIDDGLIVVEHAPREIIASGFQDLIVSSRSTKTTTVTILHSR